MRHTQVVTIVKLFVTFGALVALTACRPAAAPTPAVTAFVPASFSLNSNDCKAGLMCTFVMTGTHLDRLTDIGIGTEDDGPPTVEARLDAGVSPTKRVGAFTFDQLNGLGVGAYTLFLQTSAGWQDSGTPLDIN